MNFELNEFNNHKDFTNNVTKLKNEITNRYEKCTEISDSVKQTSNSLLSVMTKISTILATCNQQKKFAETSISSVFVKDINFINDKKENIELIDRYGDLLSNECEAFCSESNISLFPIVSQSVILNNNVKNATVILNEQFGKNLITIDTLTDINSIIDLNDTTYWRQEIFTKNKFMIDTTNDNYKLNDYGAFFEINIKLETIRRSNSMFIKLNTKYPLQLCYIKYTKTDNEHEYKVPIEIFQDGLYVDNDGITINFDNVICKNFYIGFNQPHYDLKTINIPNITLDDISKINTYKDIPVLTSTTQSGYLYEYGIATININYNDYSSVGIYETNEISSISTIDKLYIETDETMKASSEEYIDTEYYITLSSSPSFTDWIPIFPINKNEVKCEKLFNLNDICLLRFNTNNIKHIKENDRTLSTSEYTTKENGEYIYGVSIPNFSPNSIYTISYVPIAESKYIDYSNIAKVPTKSIEVIYGNENNSYQLKATPYMPSGNGCEVEILDTIKNKMYRQVDGKVVNVTGNLEYFFNKSKFQYYIDGNRIFFNQNIEERYVVKIKYNTLNSKYKVKTILRRNSNKTRETTQLINKIKVITENV